jgi:hypothetical protein
LHYFVNISWMPNLHTFNIVTMWEVREKLFVVCMKLRPLITNCSFKGDSSPSKCKKEMTCLCTSTRWKPLRTDYVDALPTPWRTQMWVQVEDSGRERSQGTLPNSQHFEG